MEVHAACTGDMYNITYGKQASKTRMMQLSLLSTAVFKWVRAIGFGEGKVQLGCLGCITLTVVFGMLGYCVLVPPHPPHARHTSGIIGKQWESRGDEHVSTSPARIAS
jgi:hypothetical protein